MKSRAILAVRLLGLTLAGLGVWQLLGNLGQSWREFDPSYLGYFLMSECYRPGLAIALGLLLGATSRRWGTWLSRGLDE